MSTTSQESPLEPKEHSLIHTFRKAKWLSTKHNLARALIIANFVAWLCVSTFSLAIEKNEANKSLLEILKRVGFSLKILNDLTIPLHTLLVCASKIDRLYLAHLLLSGVSEASFGIVYTFADASPENKSLFQILGAITITIHIFAYVFWFIPTRILYYKTFNLAKDILGIKANKLRKQLLLPWIAVCFVSASVVTVLTFLSKLKSAQFMIPITTLSTACIMLFELFMYSKINALKEKRFSCFSTVHEKFYILMAAVLMVLGILKIATSLGMDKSLNFIMMIVVRNLTKIVNASRFVFLWYYCLGELIFDMEKTTVSSINIYNDRIDFSRLTSMEIQNLEILV